MKLRRKFILMGICVGIIIIVLMVNVVRRVKEDAPKAGTETVEENVMTRAEAYRLLSYLEYNKSEREALENKIKYSDEQMSGSYDTYVNAVCNMNIIDSNITVSPKKALTYGACKEMIDKLVLGNPVFQSVYQGLSFEFTKADKNMLISDFMELYQALLAVIPEKERIVKEEPLLVLGQEMTDNGKGRMVTDKGKYYYLDAKSLENLVNQNLDKVIHVLDCDQEIISVTSVTTEKMVVHNIWIEEGKDSQVKAFINDIDKSFDTISKIKAPLEKVIGDITVENQKIVKIDVKPDMIKGKVLRYGEDFIEIEGYGKVSLDENFKIYKIYGELSVEPTGSILVGYNNTDFIVSKDKISAALITEAIKAENIRVLLKTTGYKDIYHDSVEFTAASDFTVSTKDQNYTYSKGEKVTIKPGDDILKDGRVTVKTDSDSAKIKMLSIERADGNPQYRGTLEISSDDKGLILINELPLEEYLYAVIPSEMPVSYGIEALKVQAVCARSYAYRHLLANSLSIYGAHVDDSASYQVYNNVGEDEDSILAVKDTYGEVIKYGDDVITAYYYSTSCGHSAEPSDVWANDVSLPYLKGKLLLAEKKGETIQAQSTDTGSFGDLSSEDIFKKFITSAELKAYDSSFSWYRWKVSMSMENIKKVIDSTLKDRYSANPEQILTMTDKAEGGKEAVFKSIPVDTVGDIEDISVQKRESSGIISELLIKGSKNTIEVFKDYNIRTLLAPRYDSVIRQDDSAVADLSLLPSSYFRIEKKENGFVLTGGGYGHGVGMSQNAVKGLVDAGKNYRDIIAYFYEGTQMGTIYEY